MAPTIENYKITNYLFRDNSASIDHLFELNFQEDLRQLIAKRIGLEIYLDKLSEVSRHENYSTAFKQPQLRPRTPNDLLLDHEFCRLFKALEGMIIKAVNANSASGIANGGMDLSSSDNALVMQYKDLIREQDNKLRELEQENQVLRHENRTLTQQNEELNSSMGQLRDQNMILRAQVGRQGIVLDVAISSKYML
ncbi:hypothetical protein LSTR_LSTR017386 [Laodelphax striatellus]|uniref:Vesicle tethering protein Uso1/P115-like head domain-containing protein n=1 Tax=Laodelphax striatellus TaxID=195883 RepID=A0A482WQN7_LAOST|nr:hypothetical protein LSTR_LSTR017386 [Laodelphax striatellus]